MEITSMEKGITLRGILHFYIPLNLHFYFTLYNNYQTYNNPTHAYKKIIDIKEAEGQQIKMLP